MRCPKCGYISFDQEDTCGKCSASLAEISGRLAGTGVRVRESFFLASVTGQAVQQGLATEGVEFDLAVADASPESDVDIEAAEYDEGIPMVDLSAFAQEEPGEAVAEEGISFPLPEEPEAETAGLEVGMGTEQGTIDFTFEEELLPENALQLEEEAADVDLALTGLPREAGGAQPGGMEYEPGAEEEALPELDLQMAGETEEEVDFDEELLPDLEEQAQAEEPAAAAVAAATAGSGLDLDIDVDLEDEPSEEELVFNLEDIDMSDLVIDESGAAKEKAARPEDTALDLEDFLNEGKGDDAGIPMDLTMEDIDLGDDRDKEEANKKSGDLPDLEL